MPLPLVRPNFDPKVQATLERLYADAIETDPAAREAARQQGLESESHPRFYETMKGAYLPVTPDFGTLLYFTARMTGARTIVEFGSSFGISTIYLAAAAREQGNSKVISTELVPSKAEQARRNITDAGLAEWVEIRVGDALQTLETDLPEHIDLLFLDGPKVLYLPVLEPLGSRLESHSVILSDNSEIPEAADYLAHIRDPANGLIGCSIESTVLSHHLGREILMKKGRAALG